MAKIFKAVFSAVCGGIDIAGPTAKYTDEVFDQSACPKGLEIAVLTNPFHDNKFEQCLEEYFIPKKNAEIFMDSGGFQLISGKFKGDKEAFKESVYKKMAKYAKYAFCFDENPIDGDRVYHHERVIPAARETNKNIKRQIEVFKELNANTKIFAIFQCKENERLETAEVLLEGLDNSKLAGIALNSLVWGGSGTLDFGKIAFFNELKRLYNVPNFIHLLSYGEMKLVTPFVVLQNFGWMGNDNIISTDSSSYTLGHKRWGYIPLVDGSAKRVSASANPKAWYAFQKFFSERCPEISEECKKMLHTKTHTADADSRLITTCYMLIAKRAYSEMFANPVDFGLKYGYLDEAKVNSLKELSKTTDFKQYDEWRKEFGVVWHDRRRWSDTQEKTKNTLDNFF